MAGLAKGIIFLLDGAISYVHKLMAEAKPISKPVVRRSATNMPRLFDAVGKQ